MSDVGKGPEKEGKKEGKKKINCFSTSVSVEWVKKWFPTECRLAWSLWTQRPSLPVINGPLAHFFMLHNLV